MAILKKGRPSKEDKKRDKRIEIRLNDSDFKMIEAISKCDNLSKSEVIRRALRNDYLYFHYSETGN